MAERFLSAYERRIISETGCSTTEVILVEEIMRRDILHSTLDWLTVDEFRDVAIEAYSVLKIRQSETQQ